MQTSRHTRPPSFATDTLDLERGRRRSDMPATAVLIFLYVAAVVLFSFRPGLSFIATVIGLTLALVYFVESLTKRHNFCAPPPILFFAIFLCYCMLQMVWAAGNTTSLLTLCQLFVFCIIIVNYAVNTGSIFTIELAVYIATTLSFLYVVIFGDYGRDGRIGSTVGNQNEYAYILMAAVLIVSRRILIDVVSGKISAKTLIPYLIYVALIIYGILYLAGSRAGTAVTIASLTILALYWALSQLGRRRILALFLITLVLFGMGVAVVMSPQSARFTPLEAFLRGETVEDNSLLVRDQMLKDGFALWIERPFTGWGVDEYRQVSGWGMYAHNNYVELLVNGGLAGLWLYVMIPLSAAAYLARGWLRSRGARARAEMFWALTVILALGAFDLAGVTYYSKFNWLMLSLVISVAARERALRRT